MQKNPLCYRLLLCKMGKLVGGVIPTSLLLALFILAATAPLGFGKITQS